MILASLVTPLVFSLWLLFGLTSSSCAGYTESANTIVCVEWVADGIVTSSASEVVPLELTNFQLVLLELLMCICVHTHTHHMNICGNYILSRRH